MLHAALVHFYVQAVSAVHAERDMQCFICAVTHRDACTWALQEVDMERGVLCGRSVWQLPHGKAPVVRGRPLRTCWLFTLPRQFLHAGQPWREA